MSKTLERRAGQRASLIEAAEQAIAAHGLPAMTTRELARAVGIANGAVYNLVSDVDELILLVEQRTMARLDASLAAALAGAEPGPEAALVALALAYHDFAADNEELWRAIFEHRMAPGRAIPDWAVEAQMQVFDRLFAPLRELLPQIEPERLGLTARSLFASVHGMVTLGLERKLVAVPAGERRPELAHMVRAMLRGLAAMGDGEVRG